MAPKTKVEAWPSLPPAADEQSGNDIKDSKSNQIRVPDQRDEVRSMSSVCRDDWTRSLSSCDAISWRNPHVAERYCEEYNMMGRMVPFDGEIPRLSASWCGLAGTGWCSP